MDGEFVPLASEQLQSSFVSSRHAPDGLRRMSINVSDHFMVVRNTPVAGTLAISCDSVHFCLCSCLIPAQWMRLFDGMCVIVCAMRGGGAAPKAHGSFRYQARRMMEEWSLGRMKSTVFSHANADSR